jgi:hypothetical protein
MVDMSKFEDHLLCYLKETPMLQFADGNSKFKRKRFYTVVGFQ